MANKPASLCELEKGKLIDTQQGFVDTFNFAVNAINNLEGGKNCEVDWTIPDHPVINVDIPETEGSGGGGGDVQFTGTSGTTNRDTDFTFSKESNANVTITCSGTNIKIGVYYI